MIRYFLKFSYIGTQYRGAQKQNINLIVRDTDSIQGALETALQTIVPKSLIKPYVYFSSRTDAGVHATCNTGHVDLQNKYNVLYDTNSIKARVNRYFSKCGHTIRLLECIPVTCEFNARKVCLSRTYIYRFMVPKIPNEQRIPLIESQYTFCVRQHDFDIDRVKRGTKLFLGIKDFTTFAAKKESSKKITFVRSLHDFTLEEACSLVPFDPLSENFRYWQFKCTARSFLYNQVRRMVGSLIALGLRKISEKDIIIMLQVPSHYNWNTHVTPAPPNGLHLLNIAYDPEKIRRYTISEEEQQEDNLHKQQARE